MTRCNIFISTLVLCLIGPPLTVPASVQALADPTTPDTAGGRYMFEKQPDAQGQDHVGYLRLDTQTGEVALCSQRSVGWACEAAPEDRAVLENEIARLRAENAALKKEVLSHDLPLPPGANPEPGAASPMAQNSVTLQLPSDADIDRMVAYAGQLWHRFIDAVDRAQQQVLNKS
jgi:hypothetical protein